MMQVITILLKIEIGKIIFFPEAAGSISRELNELGDSGFFALAFRAPKGTIE